MSDVPTRLLRDTLREAAAPDSSAGCLDTDTLAAWSDGTLSGRERRAAESHASHCARCQALLAAMVKTQPPAPERQWWFGWLVPIAVAATAVVVWINVPTSPSDRFAAPPSSAPSSAPAASAASATPPDRVQSNDAKDLVQPAPPPASMERRANGVGEQRRPESPRARQFDLPARAETDAPRELRESATVSPDVPPPAAPPPPRSDAAGQMAAAAAAPQANAVAPLAGTPPSPPPAGALLAAAAPGARGPALAKAAAVPAPIISPDPNVRWRIVAGGNVERSVDGGTTWQAQSTGVPATLTAGTAPTPAICWLVGPGGTVVLSVDGRTWRRVAIGETIDLTSVRASDASNATVTTADGRTFSTTDGGKTWQP